MIIKYTSCDTVVFDYIQFSKFHTHNGDDTIPRYKVKILVSARHKIIKSSICLARVTQLRDRYFHFDSSSRYRSVSPASNPERIRFESDPGGISLRGFPIFFFSAASTVPHLSKKSDNQQRIWEILDLSLKSE